MSDRDADPVGTWPVPTSRVVLLGSPGALTILPVGALFGEFGQASATVGFVLAEALVLYVGYGALARVASTVASARLAST